MCKFSLAKCFDVAERSQVAATRREIAAMAAVHSLDPAAAGRLEIVVTEAATNIIKHAGSGRMMACPLLSEKWRGMALLAMDSGPGMQEVQQCLEDGYSTSGSPGTGLGAIARLSDDFDIFSAPGQGTILAAEIYSKPPETKEEYESSGWCLPYPGESVSGDAWAVHQYEGRVALVVIDGLGHGEQAKDAAVQGVELFSQYRAFAPDRILEELHFGLRHSRGAAAAAAVISSGRLSFAGVGNIVGSVISGPNIKHLVSHNGIVGQQARKMQLFEHPFTPGSSLVLNSDGISTWSADSFPGIFTKKPALAAGVLFRDHRRARDDATVLIIKRRYDAAFAVADRDQI